MTSLAFDPFEEFQKYLVGISFKNLVSEPNYAAASKRLHKRVLALLVVEYQFGLEVQKAPSELSIATIPYLEEFRSDILSAMMILHVGLYKATLMSARSAIENIFRAIAGMQDVEFRNLKTVFELVDLVKQSPLYKSSGVFQSSLNTMFTKYGEYCDYVHSNGEEYLSLDRKLADMPRWDQEAGTICTDSILKMVQSAICILLILRPNTISALRHDQKDLVLDALPMRLKAGLAEEISI
jgi:hypothetical protein